MTGSSPFSAEPNISPILPDSRDAYQRQLVWMRTAAEIASLALTAQSLDELLQQTVSLITQRFAYYQTSIFMLDESGQYASVRAVAGNSAEQTQARDLRVVVGSRSVIGWVAAHNQPRIVGDVTQEFFYQKDELLSEFAQKRHSHSPGAWLKMVQREKARLKHWPLWAPWMCSTIKKTRSMRMQSQSCRRLRTRLRRRFKIIVCLKLLNATWRKSLSCIVLAGIWRVPIKLKIFEMHSTECCG